MEQLIPVLLGDDPNKTIQIGVLLLLNLYEQLVAFLRENANVFTWSTFDMLGISSNVIVHRLNIDQTTI